METLMKTGIELKVKVKTAVRLGYGNIGLGD
jgi:hypothetical protein